MINSKIKIEPRVIQHLGQDLITSPEVAVTELLKNSIDAGSEKINIHIFDTFDVCMNSAQFMRPLSGDFSSHVSSEIVYQANKQKKHKPKRPNKADLVCQARGTSRSD